jgi:molybdenum cofactor cytidylyltransferase
MSNISIVILAAGSSSRLGFPKQLLKLNDRSFIVHAVQEASKVSDHIVVVLGANEDALRRELIEYPVRISSNPEWQDGMSSSIHIGLKTVLSEFPATQAVILMVCDQPYVNAELLREMITDYGNSGKPIVACAYKEVAGTPSLFDKKLFPELLALSGQSGARSVISKNKDLVSTVPFPLGYLDIDTKEDYEQFIEKENQKN